MISVYIDAPFQTTYSVKTNCEDLVFLLCLKYGKYVGVSDKKADYEIEAVRLENAFEIRFIGNTRVTPHPLHEIDGILFENTKYDDRVFALHGAAVERGGKAYLFLASTTSGKTTLASYLASSGFGYITDDCILLDRESFNIYPYNTPIHLRDGGLEVLERYRAKPDRLQLLQEGPMRRFIYTPDNRVETELPLAKIFFITRTEDNNQLVNMSMTERITELMKAPITNYTVNADYIRFISRLAKTYCGRLFYSDMAYAAEVIRNG